MNLDKLRTIDTADVTGKRVLVRADLNVPVHDGKVTDATRLERLVAGLAALSARGAKVVVLSHFGRPKGGPDPQYSLAPVAAELGRLMKRNVPLAKDCIGPDAEAAVGALPQGGVLVLENRGSTRARRRTIRRSSPRSPPSAISTSTTPFRLPIGRTLRRKGSRTSCPPSPGR